MIIERWPVSSALKKEAEDNYRTHFALCYKNASALTIMRELTFDGVAPFITVDDIDRLFSFVNTHFLRGGLKGVGLEVGAGPGVFSAVLARRPHITSLYAVELCQNIVDVLAPRVIPEFAGDNHAKVTIVSGNFDALQLPDSSIDFVFDFFSLHHSDDIQVTLRELFRVLKPGGMVVCFDKARPDDATDDDVRRMLDFEYDERYKNQFGIDLDKKLTRRMNGEHEHREREWKRYFLDSSFSSFECYRLDAIHSSRGFVFFSKKMISLLPPWLQTKITWLFPHKKRLFDLSWKRRIFTPLLAHFRKEMSLMIAIK